MASDLLTPCLLSESLIEYTIGIAKDALREPDGIAKKRRAELALSFFTDILDPSIDEERRQLDIFRSYRTALDDSELASHILDNFPPEEPAPTALPANNPNHYLPVTATQQVLTLPDTLYTIFSFLVVHTKSDRNTLCKASLVSHAFYNAAKHGLWKRPRTLSTIEKQVVFAFGASISGVTGESLGQFVQHLNVKIIYGSWNMRLLLKIVSLTPNLIDLTISWGNTLDGAEVVTNESVASICKILSTLSKLEHLSLSKYSYTPPPEGIIIPIDAHIPFTRLKSLQLYRYHWLWEPIYQGLGANLETLDIGFGTVVESHQVVELSAKLPYLKSFHIGGLNLKDLVTVLTNLPALEHIYILNFSEVDDAYFVEIIRQLSAMRNLRTIHINHGLIGGAQLEQLAASSSPLEDIVLELEEEDSISQCIINFLKAKQRTLRRIYIDFRHEATFKLQPSNDIVDALAGIPNLERINIDFAEPDLSSGLSATSIDTLLTNCPELRLTDSLRVLVTGNILFGETYMDRLIRIEKEEEEELTEDADSDD
ncbi:hypothetical protein CVT25_012667 [Psilocybe cyanescens]|uniref:F-box domain-containing protein n=1 Tax=Psilocybe cyanescens TaxID=93625 RepID=A0A409VN24_PSICY|nr:hypothetical protein CVT25_012667 [Psilocybe cyanescens]